MVSTTKKYKTVARLMAFVLAIVMCIPNVSLGHVQAAAGGTYVLDATKDLTAFAEGTKTDGASETAGTDSYFTVYYSAKNKVDSSKKSFSDGYSATQRLNFGGKTDLTVPKNAVAFTTEGAATVTLHWVSGGNDRQMYIVDSAGTTVAKTSASVKNDLYIDTLEVTAAGTYYIAVLDGSNYLFKATVAEAASGATPTAAPTTEPSAPTAEPEAPTAAPTAEPTAAPTAEPAAPTMNPGDPASYELNASDMTLGDWTSNVTHDAYTIYATADKPVTVDKSAKTLNGVAYTQRLKLGGTGTATARNVSFTVDGPATVSVVVTSASGSAERVLVLGTSNGSKLTEVATATAPAGSLAEVEFNVTAAGTYCLYSKSSGINIYAINVTTTPQTTAPGAPQFDVKGVYGGRDVVLTSNTEGAVIYYSYTNEMPTTADTELANGGTVNLGAYSGYFYARAYKDGKYSDQSWWYFDTKTVSDPVITRSKNVVTITTETEGAMIVYTTDGTEPSLSNGNKRYGTASFHLPEAGTVKAVAYRSCYGTSNVVTEVYAEPQGAPARPVLDIKGVYGGRTVKATCSTEDAVIYYSTDNAFTTESDVLPAEGIVVSESTTLYVRAYKDGYWSNVVRVTLTVPQVSDIVGSIENGYLTLEKEAGVQYYFTTDGTEPSAANGKKFYVSTNRVYVGKAATVKVVGVKCYYADSEVLTINQ